jgi:hypothetical protein
MEEIAALEARRCVRFALTTHDTLYCVKALTQWLCVRRNNIHAATNTLARTAQFEFFLNKKIISVELKKTLTVILRSPIF